MRRQRRGIGLERRRDPDDPARRRHRGEPRQQRQQQAQLADTVARREDLRQADPRPATAGQALIERAEARAERIDPCSASTAPDGGVFEQLRETGAFEQGHGGDGTECGCDVA